MFLYQFVSQISSNFISKWWDPKGTLQGKIIQHYATMNKRMSFLKTLLQLNTNVDWIILRTASLPRLSFSLLSTIDTILLEDFADVFWKLWIHMEKSRLQHIVFVNCLCVRFDRFWPELFGWSFHTKSWKIWNYVDPLKTHDILYKQWHSNGQVPPSLQHDMDLMPPTSWRHCSKATSRRWRACCPGILYRNCEYSERTWETVQLRWYHATSCYKHPPQNVQLARCYETSKILISDSICREM